MLCVRICLQGQDPRLLQEPQQPLPLLAAAAAAAAAVGSPHQENWGLTFAVLAAAAAHLGRLVTPATQVYHRMRRWRRQWSEACLSQQWSQPCGPSLGSRSARTVCIAHTRAMRITFLHIMDRDQLVLSAFMSKHSSEHSSPESRCWGIQWCPVVPWCITHPFPSLPLTLTNAHPRALAYPCRPLVHHLSFPLTFTNAHLCATASSYRSLVHHPPLPLPFTNKHPCASKSSYRPLVHHPPLPLTFTNAHLYTRIGTLTSVAGGLGRMEVGGAVFRRRAYAQWLTSYTTASGCCIVTAVRTACGRGGRHPQLPPAVIPSGQWQGKRN